jgi:hypothetical protein
MVQPLLMPHSTYRSLSLDGLYQLLTISVRDMFVALDTQQDSMIAYKSLRKQVELLLEVIEEKKQEAKQKDGIPVNTK